MNSPADAAESHQTEKVGKTQARTLQRKSCRSTNILDRLLHNVVRKLTDIK